MGALGQIENGTDAWNRDAVESLIAELTALRSEMTAFEAGLVPRLGDVEPTFQGSARNLAHYLALRRTDIRSLQERLAWVGASSPVFSCTIFQIMLQKPATAPTGSPSDFRESGGNA